MSTLLPRLLASTLLLAGVSEPALAQVATPPEATAPAPPAPGGGEATDPCAGQPETQSGQSLSGQLSDCGGVLTPPDTGASGIEVPAPDPEPNTTPVVPPSQLPEQAPNDATGSDSG